ncbi:unnamed protein product [Ixodes pacificus]
MRFAAFFFMPSLFLWTVRRTRRKNVFAASSLLLKNRIACVVCGLFDAGDRRCWKHRTRTGSAVFVRPPVPSFLSREELFLFFFPWKCCRLPNRYTLPPPVRVCVCVLF